MLFPIVFSPGVHEKSDVLMHVGRCSEYRPDVLLCIAGQITTALFQMILTFTANNTGSLLCRCDKVNGIQK